jgi:thymidylate synthase (FAD)
MTKQCDVIADPNYIPILDHGFIGLIDTFGNDGAIVQAARTSYGTGTKSVREDRGLIRYLMRHQHTSPFEQCEVKLHIKLPIFVMRQLVRHRTASLNEWSGRYSIMSDEFYVPDLEHIKPQSDDNKQGRAGEIDPVSREGVAWLMKSIHDSAYKVYNILLGDRENAEDYCDPYSEDSPLLANDFPGIARELARTVLPVSNYTEAYFKMDLLNLFKMLKLRADSHAQYEIRVYADAICKLAQPKFPLAFEAFEDYMRDSVTLSRMEMRLIREFFDSKEMVQAIQESGEDATKFGAKFGLSKREMIDFMNRFC